MLWQLLADIQGHLGVVIPEIPPTMDVPANEFDGQVRMEVARGGLATIDHSSVFATFALVGGAPWQVVYGEKRSKKGPAVSGHTALLAPSVQELSNLEHAAQTSFISLKVGGRLL